MQSTAQASTIIMAHIFTVIKDFHDWRAHGQNEWQWDGKMSYELQPRRGERKKGLKLEGLM